MSMIHWICLLDFLFHFISSNILYNNQTVISENDFAKFRSFFANYVREDHFCWLLNFDLLPINPFYISINRSKCIKWCLKYEKIFDRYCCLLKWLSNAANKRNILNENYPKIKSCNSTMFEAICKSRCRTLISLQFT